ncbi:hypothetical protein AX17_001692 [Amanita inopinata Kibby_2008]|nr:hypothetical protein AX17_001692 [Amanita inopinata Kibby_2008]
MVLISSKKYACETCIKGHRSSTCKHTDRPLYEIKKKGRPVTQCEHCRELRKTKQVHVKCICELKEDILPSQSPSSGKKGTKIPQSAAFPNGLPEDLEVAAASQLSSGGLTSDSCHGGNEQSSCMCKSGGPCHCWTPRHTVSRKNIKIDSHTSSQGDSPSAESSNPVRQPHSRLSMSQILARVKELRPVLPRPASSNSSNSGPVHDLASGMPHSIPSRYHMHENVMFSPYGRAHDRTHEHPLGHEKLYFTGSSASIPSYLPPVQGSVQYEPTQPVEPIASHPSTLQQRALLPSSSLPYMSACNCGGTCHCIGCEPNKANNIPAVNSCNVSSPCHSNSCTACLECSYFISHVPTSDPTLPLDAHQRVAIDEWLRQVSTPHSGPDFGVVVPGLPPQDYRNVEGVSQTLSRTDLTVRGWDESASGPSVNKSVPPSNQSDECQTYASTPECCGGQCNCPPNSCTCKSSDYFSSGGTYSGAATLATPGERASSCVERFSQLQLSQGMSRSDTHLVLPDVYQNRPPSAPQSDAMPGVTEFPYSASMSALDVTKGSEVYENVQSTATVLLNYPGPVSHQSPVPTNFPMPWMAGNGNGNPSSTSHILPVTYSYAVSNPGTDHTSSSFDDLSMTLRTPM